MWSPQNHRVAKANSDYYILKNTSAPTVIVECGFLSNPEEGKPADKCRVPGKTGGSLAEGNLRVSGGALIKVLSGAVNVWRPDRTFHFRIKILTFYQKH